MWVWRESRNYFNLLPSIFDMVYSNTNPECKLKQRSLVIQPSDTPSSNENNASEETCTENLTIFSTLFNLHVEEERINAQKGRIFSIVWKIILMESFRKKKKVWVPTLPKWKREGRGMGGIGLPFHLCMHIHKYMCVCVCVHIFYVWQLFVEKVHSSFSFDRKINSVSGMQFWWFLWKAPTFSLNL